MRVLYYGLFDVAGGMESFARDLICSICRAQPSVSFVIIKSTPTIAYQNQLQGFNCEFADVPNQNKRPTAYFHALLQLFKMEASKGSILHLNVMSYRNLLLFKAARLSKIQTIITGHGSGIGKTPSIFLHYFFRFAFRHFGTKIAISQQAADFCFGRNSTVMIIENAIDSTKYQYQGRKHDELRRSLNIPDSSLVLLQVGRISQLKNQSFSLDLLQQLLGHQVDATLVFVGAEQDDHPRKKAEQMGLADHVRFIGNTESAPYYSMGDVLLVPSIKEGAGLVVEEGMANGIPIIASDSVPHRETLSYPIDYLPLNVDLWTSKIAQFKDKRTAGITSTSLFDFAQKYLAVYTEVSKGSS